MLSLAHAAAQVARSVPGLPEYGAVLVLPVTPHLSSLGGVTGVVVGGSTGVTSAKQLRSEKTMALLSLGVTCALVAWLYRAQTPSATPIDKQVVMPRHWLWQAWRVLPKRTWIGLAFVVPLSLQTGVAAGGVMVEEADVVVEVAQVVVGGGVVKVEDALVVVDVVVVVVVTGMTSAVQARS